ncbi:hypothetical protein DV737_g1513, partial [Chaetothyriales sp. CBS 132003]
MMTVQRNLRVASSNHHETPKAPYVDDDNDYPLYKPRDMDAAYTRAGTRHNMKPEADQDGVWVNISSPSRTLDMSQHVSGTSNSNIAALRTSDSCEGDGECFESCIFANLAIPGRGDPVPNAAIGVSKDGTITFFGPQEELPVRLSSVHRVNVGYILPGLWDCHTHFSGLFNTDFPDIVGTHPSTCGALAARSMYEFLMAGFTSARDVGSYALEIAPAINVGWLLGPNIFGAGAAIGITGGSCDACTLPADWVYSRQGSDSNSGNPFPGVAHLVLADGVEQCRLAVRQQIRRGAACIKIVASGGVLSRTDDVHSRQYSDEELRVMIEEAHLQGREVACHAHGKAGIMAAVRAGATTIEHGSYIDDEAAKLMVSQGVTLVPTRTVAVANLSDLDSLTPETRAKMIVVAAHQKKAYATAVRHGVKIALGTDIVGVNPHSVSRHGRNGHELAYAVEAGLTPLQAIEAGTINAAETLGKQMPKKGLIRVGWDADLIALDENPLENIRLFADPNNIKNIWKAGLHVKSKSGQLLWPISAPKKTFF